MARFKPTNPAAPPTGRIDGIVYVPQMRTPVLRVWKPVQQHPTAWFDTTNRLAQQNDLIWAGLPDSNKVEWLEWAGENASKVKCSVLEPSTGGTVVVDPGRAAFMAVNCWRYVTGQALYGPPPVSTVVFSGDGVVLNVSTYPRPAFPPPAGYLTATWLRPGTPPVGTFYLGVWGLALTHEAESGPTTRRYGALATFAISYGVPLDLAPWLAANPGLFTGGILSLGVAIGETDNPPFVAQIGTASYTTPVVPGTGYGNDPYGNSPYGGYPVVAGYGLDPYGTSLYGS